VGLNLPHTGICGLFGVYFQVYVILRASLSFPDETMKKSNPSCLPRRSFSEGGLLLSKIKIPMPLGFIKQCCMGSG